MNENEKMKMNEAKLRDEKNIALRSRTQIIKRKNLSIKEIGDIYNRNGIKVIECQPGCFN